MALNRLTEDVNVISKLDNYPPDDPGMTPDKLKSLFDKGSNTIKDYINNTLLPQLEQGYVSSIARTSGDGSPGSTDTYTITFHDGSTKTFQVYNGRDGIDGEKGDKGDTGNGIASAVLNEDYTLTLTFTDGTSYTTPSIRGAKGDKGDTGDKGDKGEKGAKGDPGPGLEFDWNGTQLGVRVEGQEDYVYVNLKGEKGDKGDTGAGLEFNWNGTQLGIRQEGQSSYQYVNLKGDKGDTGPAPNIIVGSVTTLPPGSNATVNRRSGSPDTAPIFDFGIPRGLDGKDGKDGKDAVLPFDIWVGTLAEYNALPYEQRNNPNFVHCIYEE